MKYKNIIFDFGNVIGKFKGDYILGKFASTPEDYDILADAIFKNWVALDAGTIDYDQNAEDTIAELPDHLKDTARDFFENWFQYVDPLPETWKFIKELKARGVPIYLLSNYSEELFHMHTKGAKFLDVLDGGVVSYQVHALKPDREIYEILLEKYNLKAEACLFFDDRADNVEGAKKVGIQAIQVTSREMLNETLDKMLTE